MKRLDYIYLRNDPDIILENMRIYKYSNNYHEKNDARDYLLGIYKDANTFTIDQKIPDDIKYLPSNEGWMERKESLENDRQRLYNDLNPKKSKTPKIPKE